MNDWWEQAYHFLLMLLVTHPFYKSFLGTILQIIYVPGKTATKQVHKNASMKVHCMAWATLEGGPHTVILEYFNIKE